MTSSLDSGIERAVRLLQSSGIETFESCEGGKRLAAAFRAISARRFLLSFLARAARPLAPSSGRRALRLGRGLVLVARGDPHDLDGGADHVGRALLTLGLGHGSIASLR